MKKLAQNVFASLSLMMLTATTATAFSNDSYMTEALGACTVNADTDSSFSNASLYIENAGAIVTQYADAKTWSFGGVSAAYLIPVSVFFLESDCGLHDVSSLTQYGADGSKSFLTQTEMFIRFQGRETVAGPLLDFDITMDDAGVLTITQTPVAAPAPAPAPAPPPDPAPATDPVPTINAPVEIANYLRARNRHLINAQPDLIGLVTRQTTGGFDANLTNAQGRFNFAYVPDVPVWAEVQGQWSKDGIAENSYLFAVVGAHQSLGPNLWLGAMFQFDDIKRSKSTDLSGSGWLAGPYLVAKMPDQPLYFEARVLGGKTQNSLEVDRFDTQRLLVSARVAGQLQYGRTVLVPSLSATHLRETQQSYLNSAGTTIPEQSAKTSNATIGLDVEHELSVANGNLWLNGGVSASWSDRDAAAQGSVLPAGDSVRGRAHLGLRHVTPGGTWLSAQVHHDGIGLSDYEGYGVTFRLERKF